jgi:hypothetical protein
MYYSHEPIRTLPYYLGKKYFMFGSVSCHSILDYDCPHDINDNTDVHAGTRWRKTFGWRQKKLLSYESRYCIHTKHQCSNSGKHKTPPVVDGRKASSAIDQDTRA